MAGPGFDSPAALDYIVPESAAAVESREFDYDLLVRPLEPRLMRTIWRIVRRRETAEDALQEALTVIWKKRRAVAGHPNPQALILRIAVTTAIDALRRERRRWRHEAPERPEGRTRVATEAVGRDTEARELGEAILGAVGRLPRRQAAAVMLRIVEERSYEEVARVMGCSETTVRVHVLKGRAALTKRLARERPDLVDGFDRKGKESGP